MPSKSEKQRAFLNWHFGHDWVKAHHFDNRGRLPTRVKPKAKKGKRKRGG